MCNRPSGMRPEAQLSDPMNWDTSCSGLACSVCLLTETGGVIKLDGLGGVLTSRRDMGLPISPDNGAKLPQTSKYLRSSVQTEGKYSKLMYSWKHTRVRLRWHLRPRSGLRLR